MCEIDTDVKKEYKNISPSWRTINFLSKSMYSIKIHRLREGCFCNLCITINSNLFDKNRRVLKTFLGILSTLTLNQDPNPTRGGNFPRGQLSRHHSRQREMLHST